MTEGIDHRNLDQHVRGVVWSGATGKAAAYEVLNAVSSAISAETVPLMHDVRFGLKTAAQLTAANSGELGQIVDDRYVGVSMLWRRFNDGREAAHDRGNTITGFIVYGDGVNADPILEFRETERRGYEWRDLRQGGNWQTLNGGN
tara:strand:+ start:176 stop:610 length:435 start_codon:yes stop_codon:yes gene_type:complete